MQLFIKERLHDDDNTGEKGRKHGGGPTLKKSKKV